MVESFSYRSRKWLLQQITQNRDSDQLNKLSHSNWDILVILDACRYDVLQDISNWPIEQVKSPASCTPEWLFQIQKNGLFDDSRIITGNPQYENTGFEGEIEPYWKTHWNDDLSTVLPEKILDRVTELVSDEKGPVVAHLQQPHWPYIAKLGERWHLAYDETGPWSRKGEKIESVQVAMERGVIDSSSAWKAYRASVFSIWDTILDNIDRWLKNSKKIVITSDHGETFGRIRDYKFYEHPCGCHVKPLVSVPWVSFEPNSNLSPTEDTVDDRLKALGYAE